MQKINIKDMEERYIATVDLGTSKLALSVARISGDDTEILFYREHPSDGVRCGCIFNPTKASVPLKKAIREAEDELSIKINQVVIGLPRYGVTQETSSAEVQRSDADLCISQEEIDTIKNIALDSYPLDDEQKQEIYGASAQSFSTDDSINYTEEDVVGMPSSVLKGNFKVFVGDKNASHNIDIMLNMAEVAPACKCFLPQATADAVLTSEEKDNGIALIEMGAGVTSVTIYQGEILRYYYALPFGGKSITNDIKQECGFSGHLAENIKLGFGACLPDKLQSMSDKILQIRDDENGNTQQLAVKYLSEIITARAKEIVEAILFKIQESGYADRLRNGVVLTGGCANLANCANLIKEMSGYNVRIGYPRLKNFIHSDCPGIGEASAVSSVGLLNIAKQNRHLNCTSAYIATKPASEATRILQKAGSSIVETIPPKVETRRNEAETQGAQDLTDTVFETRKEPTGPKAQSKLRQSIYKWTKKLSKATIKPVGEWVGGLYDNMENNEEN